MKTEVVTNTVVETEDVAEDVVIKAEVADDDSLGNALTEENQEPFVIQTVVKSFRNEYVSPLLKGNVKLSEFNHEMKNKIILALCTKLAVNRTTLERGAYILQLRSSLITDSDPALNDMLAILEQKKSDELLGLIKPWKILCIMKDSVVDAILWETTLPVPG